MPEQLLLRNAQSQSIKMSMSMSKTTIEAKIRWQCMRICVSILHRSPLKSEVHVAITRLWIVIAAITTCLTNQTSIVILTHEIDEKMNGEIGIDIFVMRETTYLLTYWVSCLWKLGPEIRIIPLKENLNLHPDRVWKVTRPDGGGAKSLLQISETTIRIGKILTALERALQDAPDTVPLNLFSLPVTL